MGIVFQTFHQSRMSFTWESICKDFNLTEDQYQEYKSAFDMFDTDGSGDISCTELVSVMTQLGKAASEEDARAMIQTVDENGDGEIDFREFINMMKSNDTDTDDELRRAFDIFDADNSGFIDREELKAVIAKLMGAPLSEEELDAMMKEADTNSDGQVSFEEFKAMMGN